MAIVLLAVAAVSEAIGVQAFLGAFLAGVAFSGVANGTGAAGHKALSHVAVGVFAPLFFVSMALRTDFIEAFDPLLVITVLLFALAAKLVSVVLGVRLAGLPAGREAWAVAWGLNARGATGIILAATGLQVGIIDDEVFVALVVMAIVTSILAGPMMVWALGPLREGIVVETDEEGLAPAMEHATRVLDRDLTEDERAALKPTVFYRVAVAIDDPATAQPLVAVATQLAASQRPSEVVLISFKLQTDLGGRIAGRVLDEIASELGALRNLEQIVHDAGITPVSVSQRSTDLASGIVDKVKEIGAHAIVVGDRRDDPTWVSTVDRLIAASPVDIFVVVAPRPRAEEGHRSGALVVEAAAGLPGDASLEAAVRFALSGTSGPVVVGLSAKSKRGPTYRAAIDDLTRLNRPGQILEAGLDTIEGAAVAAEAPFVLRPFAAPEGLEPIERARPDAERFGCPIVLVAPDPNRLQRVSLHELLSTSQPATSIASIT